MSFNYLRHVKFADLHWGGFTTQWVYKKRINGADEKNTIGWNFGSSLFYIYG